MVRNSGEFVACLEQAAHQCRTGLELVVQISERPNES